MYSNRPALSNTFRKKINFYAAAIIALPAFDETTWQAKALSPHFLPPSGHRLTTQTGCLMLLQKPESVRENAREWYTNYPATWSHGLQQLRKKLDLFGLKTDSLPPITDTDDTRQGTHAACSVKKNGLQLHTGTRLFFMVGMARFERAASASRTLRSSQTEPHPVAREDITPKACRMQAFFQKNFSPLASFVIRSCQRSPGHSGTCFAHIGQLGFDFMKKGAKTHIPVRLPGKNFFEVALCRTQVPRTILATARS